MEFEEKGNSLADEGAEDVYKVYGKVLFPEIHSGLEWDLRLGGSTVTGDKISTMNNSIKIKKGQKVHNREREKIWG